MTRLAIDDEIGKQDAHEKILGAMDTLFAELVELCLEPESSFASREEQTLTLTNAIGRRHLAAQLHAISNGFAERIRIKRRASEPDCILEKLGLNWRTYRRHQRGTQTYFSLCGPLEIERSTYREIGIHNGPTVVPLDLRAGFLEGLSPLLAKSVTLGYSKGPLRSYLEDMKLALRCTPPRATLERKAKAIAKEAIWLAPSIEDEIRCEERVPDDATTVALGVDRAAVPMAEASDFGRKRRRNKPYQRKQPPPTTVNWRMDYVATMSFVDAEGESIRTRRYHLAHDQPGVRITDKILCDLAYALEQKNDLRVVVVQDGAPEMWNAIRASFERFQIPTGFEVLDWYHASERVSACLLLVEKDDNARNTLREKWNERFFTKKRAAGRFLASLKRRKPSLPKAARTELETHINYFAARKHLMKYAELRDQKIPIGSGATEGACKSLIAARAKRSGQRWSRNGLDAVLNLRAIHQSDRFEPFWRRFEPHFRAAEIQPT